MAATTLTLTAIKTCSSSRWSSEDICRTVSLMALARSCSRTGIFTLAHSKTVSSREMECSTTAARKTGFTDFSKMATSQISTTTTTKEAKRNTTN